MTVGTKIPAYEALAVDLKAIGTQRVFGLMSDDTAQLLTTADAMGVRFCAARHETNSIAMAVGYAAATGHLGIAVLGRGPAAANSVHGATFAARSGAKVLLIYGSPPVTSAQRNGFGPDTKVFDTAGVLRAAGLPVFVASDSRTARHTLAQAVTAAMAGTVALILPMDVQSALIDVKATAVEPQPKLPTAQWPARLVAVRTAAELLHKSRRPLIVAGRGAHAAGAREELIRLADHLGAALVTTAKAKDMFRGYPFDCGVAGSLSHARGRRLMDQVDCVLVFGAGLNQRTTSFGTSFPADAPLIQVDNVRSHIGRWLHANVALVGDARLVAEQLLEAIPTRSDADKPLHTDEFQQLLSDADPSEDFRPASTARTMDPRSLTIELDRLLPRDRNVVYDSGNMLQALTYLSVPGPDNIMLTSDFGSIGIGFGSALGFAVGSPDRTTVLVVGDGSFVMTMSELETAAREQIPLVIVLMNDCAYGAELHYLKLRNMPVGLSVFPDVDFAPVAEAFGFQSATVRTIEELRQLAPMLASPEGPILLDCKINADVMAPFMSEAAPAVGV